MRAALSARLRRAADRLDPPPPPPPPLPPPVHDWTRRDIEAEAPEAQPVTDVLAARLLPEDEAGVVDRLEGGAVEAWDAADAAQRRRLVLSFGVYIRLPGVLERTGLVPDEPPEDVHAMARGAFAAGGDYYSADFVVAALERSGGEIGSVRRALDFGCSSGRTVRPLAAAYPHVQWHGVDPNGPAIAWAAEHVPAVAFAPSASEPPLAFGDGELDLVYAISIWSHFAEDAARRWLDEMQRLIAPGGHLVITVHGAESIAFYGRHALRPPEQLDEIAKALHRSGFWFAQEFGEDGDHGVAHPEWGTAFMSAEWLLRAATPAWQVVDYAVGRNAGNQDVAVLRRAP